MNIRYFGKGFNYDQDGPGNRLVYHLMGCNMRCPWCSNPEGMDVHREGRDITEVPANEMLLEIHSCAPMFYDGGGVTFTGGEATLQIDAVKYILTILKREGINTAIETNGTSPRLSELFPLLDLLICDLKHTDSDKLCSVIGVSGETIYRNLRAAAEADIPLLIRIPLIHGFNDDETSFDGFADFLSSLPSSGFSVELLAYHEYGKDKWKKLGLPYTVENGTIRESDRKRLAQRLCDMDIRIVTT